MDLIKPSLYFCNFNEDIFYINFDIDNILRVNLILLDDVDDLYVDGFDLLNEDLQLFFTLIFFIDEDSNLGVKIVDALIDLDDCFGIILAFLAKITNLDVEVINFFLVDINLNICLLNALIKRFYID